MFSDNAAGADGVHLDHHYVGRGHVAHPTTAHETGPHRYSLVEELVGLVTFEGIGASFALENRVAGGQDPSRHPPHRTTARVSIEEPATGGQNGRSFTDGQIGQGPGGLRRQHIGGTPPGPGDIAETLNGMH